MAAKLIGYANVNVTMKKGYPAIVLNMEQVNLAAAEEADLLTVCQAQKNTRKHAIKTQL